MDNIFIDLIKNNRDYHKKIITEKNTKSSSEMFDKSTSYRNARDLLLSRYFS